MININYIKSLTLDYIYKRGEDCYRSGNILAFDLNKENNDLEFCTINSHVKPSLSQGFYEVEISIKNGNIISANCDCAYFEREGEFCFCKHLIAVLLKFYHEHYCSADLLEKLSKQKKLAENNKLFLKLKNLMFKDIYKENNLVEKKPLNIFIKYEHEGFIGSDSFVELKIGDTKPYVVKNLREFLEAFKNNTELFFGKNFTYNPKLYSILPEDKKLLNFLCELMDNDSMIQKRSFNYYHSGRLPKFISGKKAFLTDEKLLSLFKIIEGKKIEAVIKHINYSNVEVKKEDLPIEFSLTATEYDGVTLSISDDLPQMLSYNGSLFFYKNSIFIPSAEQSKLYFPFHTSLIEGGRNYIEFSKAERENLAAYVLPNLKTIATKLKIDNKLSESFYGESLKTELFFDKVDECVFCKVNYIYGDTVFDPQAKNNSMDKKILIRDIKKELLVTSTLFSLGFKKNDTGFILEDEDKILEFISNGIYKLQEIAEIFYSESFKSIKIYTSSSYKSSVKMQDNNLLHFNFSIEGVEREELKNIFMSLKQKKKYHKLKNGSFVSLENKELKEIHDILSFLDIKEEALLKEQISLSKFNALYLDQKLKNASFYVERSKQFREIVHNVKEHNEMEFILPEKLDNVLRGYQKTGFKWFKTLSSYGFGGILADEMGLGKTLQTIAFLLSEKENTKDPSLVICPTSLVYNWEEEIIKFAPTLKTTVISGNKKAREEMIKDIKESDIVITSYPLIRRDIEEYKELQFNYCILDEAQGIKNPNSINAKSVKEINAKGYFALTGTPIENSLMELWSIFDFIMPSFLLSSRKFSQKYEVPIVKDKNKKALEDLNYHIKPFILRRLKKDVIKELPPKIEHKVLVEMSEEQKKLYSALVASYKQEIDMEIAEKGFNMSKFKILSALTRLRQICCDPSVFLEDFQGESGKMQALEDIIQDSVNSNHRILLFSQFTSVLKNISKLLCTKEIEHLYLDGSTKSEIRGKMVREFNNGIGDVFLISLKAGGTGLNLTGADMVIHFDPWWNPAVEEQASDRAHRIGQQKTVEVIKLIAKGTIEEKIWNLQERKKDMVKNVIGEGSNEEIFLSSMTEEEMQQLFVI